MATADLGSAEWERSKISAQDINLLKKLGISKKKDSLCFPSEESYPSPPIEYRVSFVDHLIRGLSSSGGGRKFFEVWRSQFVFMHNPNARLRFINITLCSCTI
jgi:hypothetical protein